MSGPNVMIGYWKRRVETRETVDEDGWLHTGDAAPVDDEGFVCIVDRAADAMDASGHRVYPGDIDPLKPTALSRGPSDHAMTNSLLTNQSDGA